MTPGILKFSEAAGATERTTFARSFSECAPGLRETELAPFAPSAQYTGLVLESMQRLPHELFLVREGDHIVGRAAVCALRAENGVAGIGLFESGPGDQREAATGCLIDAACRWASENKLPRIFAPIDLNSWFSYRFLLPPLPGHSLGPLYPWEPVQPLDHAASFMRRGFEEAERYRTIIGDFDEPDAKSVATLLAMPTPAADHATADGYVFERLTDHAGLPALLDEAYGVCTDAFSGSLLFEPIGPELFRTILLAGASTRDCTLTHWVHDPSGRMVGFALAFVDDGAVVVKTIAIAPGARGKHLSSALTQLTINTGLSRGLKRLISALVRSGNTSEFLGSPYAARAARLWTHEYVLLHRASTI